MLIALGVRAPCYVRKHACTDQFVVSVMDKYYLQSRIFYRREPSTVFDRVVAKTCLHVANYCNDAVLSVSRSERQSSDKKHEGILEHRPLHVQSYSKHQRC